MKIMLANQSHAQLLSTYYQRNSARFKPWDPIRDPGYHEIDTWRERLQIREIEFKIGQSAHFIGVNDSETRMIGGCSFTNILPYPLLFCYLGYSIDGNFEGKGLMTKIVCHGIEYMFNERKLNRISANHMPNNLRSAALLAKLGFEQEGYAKRYLLVNGQWQDHVLTSLLNPDASIGEL